MTKPDLQFYGGREQAYVKHRFLTHYLERLAIKVGWFQRVTLNYVDGYSGPWQSQDEALSDTSPHLAVRALRSARDALVARTRPGIVPRAFFVEKDPASHRRLVASLIDVSDVAHIERCSEFEDQLAGAVEFAQSGVNPFAFVFIDPKGWSGIEPQVLRPVLGIDRSEFLVNFMTKDISRFIDSPRQTIERSFIRVFGTLDCRTRWQQLQGIDREDEIVATYCERLQSLGTHKHVVSAVVLNPSMDRAHYHLVYGTNNAEGLATFREVERSLLPVQRSLRADVKEQKRAAKEPTGSLFGADALDTPYLEGLKARYMRRARETVLGLRRVGSTTDFDTLALTGMHLPMTAEADVKRILGQLRDERLLEFEGLAPRTRALKRGHQHSVRWL